MERPPILDYPWQHQLWLWPLLTVCGLIMIVVALFFVAVGIPLALLYAAYCVVAWPLILLPFHAAQRCWVKQSGYEPYFFNLQEYLKNRSLLRGAMGAPAYIPVAIASAIFVAVLVWGSLEYATT